MKFVLCTRSLEYAENAFAIGLRHGSTEGRELTTLFQKKLARRGHPFPILILLKLYKYTVFHKNNPFDF